jgi:SAM-dependent methyltransferase
MPWHPRSNLARKAIIAACYVFGRTVYAGSAVHCPCCNARLRTFLPAGAPQRAGALCPACGSLERHRLLWLYLEKNHFFSSQHLSVLDIAPLPYWEMRMRRLKNLQYVSTDLASPHVMLRADLMHIPFRDGRFDGLLCSHVLEHVTDDRRALRELFRVLKTGGWAIIQSPVDPGRERTYEDPAVQCPEERARLFGQSDHLRVYGLDYAARIEKAGFQVRMDGFFHEVGKAAAHKYGLLEEEIPFCIKPKTDDP